MQVENDDMVYDEDIVVKGLQKGDRKIYRLLFDTYYRILCLYATSLTLNRSSAEDIVQEVFIKLWAKKGRLQIDSSLKNYLYRSVYNTFLNERKRNSRKTNDLDQIHIEMLQASMEEEEQSIKRKLEWINAQIEQLPKKSKEIFIMHKKRGLTHSEIAQILGVSVNTVESHIARALKRIREKLPKPLMLFFFCLIGILLFVL